MQRLEKAKELLDLAAWLEDYADIKHPGGDEIQVCECPICGDDRYKLYVNVEKQRWICYICEYGRGMGDVVRLMADVSGRSLSSVRLELLATVPPAPSGDLAQQLQKAFDGENPGDEEDEPEAPEVFVPGKSGFKDSVGENVLEYARERGLTDRDLRRFGMRAAKSVPTPRDKWIRGPFLVTPITVRGTPRAWQGRRVIPREPKYMSSPDIKNWLFPLDEEFFTTYISSSRSLYLVEGVFDAIGMSRLGLPALCTFGTSVSASQLSILQDLSPERIVFVWDMGADREIIRTVSRIAYHFKDARVALTAHPSGSKVDAGDSLRDPAAGEWIKEICSEGKLLDVQSTEFFKWRMTHQ
jgi:DNA primase